MTSPDLTCWTLIRDAAGGDTAARERFARVYRPVAVAALAGRWKGSPRLAWVDDAAQDVFVECFKAGGALDSADAERGGFRAFFLAVVRNVARRYEEKHRPAVPLPEDHADGDTSLSVAFDRAWARALLKEAARVQGEAARGDERATKRVELLRLRFQDGLPIRAIAERWSEDAAKLHREYATAREEFRAALRNVVAFHHPGAAGDALDAACRELLALVG
jgi:RNA polymerase sigma factor (sigma-70 family)